MTGDHAMGRLTVHMLVGVENTRKVWSVKVWYVVNRCIIPAAELTIDGQDDSRCGESSVWSYNCCWKRTHDGDDNDDSML